MVVPQPTTSTANTQSLQINPTDARTGSGLLRSAMTGERAADSVLPPLSESHCGNGDTGNGDEGGGDHDRSCTESISARPTPKGKKRKCARKTALKVATLNINGFGNLVRDHNDNKWGKVYRMMSENRIGVLLLQETHLTAERKAAIHAMFAKKIKVFHSENPEAPTQREGVAVVLNARYIKTSGALATEIVPGRALQVAIPCQGGDTKRVLCIYAPTSNGVAERKAFFDEVRRYYDTRPGFPRPHLMAGDFNNIEDSLDRLPVGEGPDSSIAALDDLKISIGLMVADGWRVTNPNAREYTFHRGTGRDVVFSRLDRIYMAANTFDCAREWVICEAGVRTDHCLVMVQLTPENAPLVGQGRPVFPLQLIKDKTLTKNIKARGLEALDQLARLGGEGTRTDEANPQRVLHSFKNDVMAMARDREREVVPRLLAEIRDRERALKSVKNNRDMSEHLKVAEATALTKQIRQLKQQRYKQQQMNSRATHRLFGDRPTKYWSKLHRECAPRDLISAFEREDRAGVAGEKVYEHDSIKMAEMARRHHMNVQRDDAGAKPADARNTDIETALNSLDAVVSVEQAAKLGSEITYEECAMSLRLSKNGTAPGLDGMPFEVWKALHARHIEDSRFPDRPDFDVVKLLAAALEDIRIHGVCARTHFAQGWIAPIYKEKGERSRVVNYRPITLLNTDYKLLSKALAVRLAGVALDLIHRAQAGFVPGRKIHNHTQLARLMMSWAETNDQNGAIVALDQEKAYDKIAHDYLWRVLAKFGIPSDFVRLVKSLYANANTSVMINGFLSKSYRVYRGVRQGDPLSCLLFDLAIEPLSAMIRKSDIMGFSIPKCDEILKAVLFADDTTVYLSHNDDFGTLQAVLDTWCSAAKARFNIGKTEIIPLGTPTFRDEMAETYRVTGAWKNYPRGVHVAQNGEAVRILGAFFGNNVVQADVWSLVLTKIVAMRKPLMHAIERWKTGHATLQGKKHVVQMIIGGMTQFLTTVQRMPDTIVQRLTKIMRGYLWDDRHNPPVSMDHVYLPVEQGGLGMLDLNARCEAIDVMWLKTYLDFSEERPLWAFLADDLLATMVPKNCKPRNAALRINPFLQRWKPRVYGLPDELQGMMNVARKYGVRLEGLAFTRRTLETMLMWDHALADRIKLGRLSIPSRLLSCLQNGHAARTVRDFMSIAEVLNDPSHKPRATCMCTRCNNMRAEARCDNPHLCGVRAKAMIDTIPNRWNPRCQQPDDHERDDRNDLLRENLEEGAVPFDRRVTTHGNIGHAIRIFTDPGPTADESVPMALEEDGSRITIATDGSCTNNGESNARAGAGIYVGEDHALNRSFRLPDGIEQSNQTGEVVATLLATTAAGPCTRVLQVTDSQTTMDSLTRWRQRHEDTGYILQTNATLLQATVAQLRIRKAHTIFQWVKGHDGHPGNEAADKLAALGAGKPTGDQLCLSIPPLFRVSGAKLQSMTQQLAYKAIRMRLDPRVSPRPRTVANLDRISTGIQATYGVQLHDAAIWRSFRSKHVSRTASQFLWMATHDGYMIGSHWLRPNMSEELRTREVCAICGERESMSHIIFECRAVGQEQIWDRLKELWLSTGAAWNEPCWGSAFGAACAVFKTDAGRRRSAIESLWCILCTETLHLIWKLRCERVIQREGVEFNVQQVTNRFYSTLESRLNLDRRTAVRARGKRSLKPSEVSQIWLPVIEGGKDLPPGWVTQSGVLVGIKRGR